MNLVKVFTIVATLIFATSTWAMGKKRHGTDPEVVKNVDLNRYSGLWYEVAHTPNFFQRPCVQSTAQYEVLNASQISVFNTCFKKNGKTSTISGTATVLNSEEPAKLRVVFDILFKPKGDYWIVALDEQYQWAVVSGPGMGYNFILSRMFPLAPNIQTSIIQSLKEKGFPTQEFIFDQEVI